MKPSPSIVILCYRVGGEKSDKKEIKDGLPKDDDIIHLVHIVIANKDKMSTQDGNAEEISNPHIVLIDERSEGGVNTNTIDSRGGVVVVYTLIILYNS